MIELSHLPPEAVEEFVKVTTSLSTERDLNRFGRRGGASIPKYPTYSLRW